MSATQTPTCALNLSAETLSSYRDAALPADERERVAAHVPTCARCRVRLDGYERAADAIRAERVPTPDSRLWREVRAELDRRPRSAGRLSLPSRQLLSGLGAVAAVLLLVVGFARLLNRAPAHGPVTGTPLSWVRHSLPGNASFASPRAASGVSVAVSPVDGNLVYACSLSLANGHEPAVYTSHDRGDTWAFDKVAMSQAATECAVTPDEHDPQRAIWVAGIPDAAGHLVAGSATAYQTTDGGQTWAQMTPMPDEDILQLATANGNSIALTYDTQSTGASSGATGNVNTPTRLVVSYNGMLSWLWADMAIVNSAQHVQQFWLGYDGTIYAMTAPNDGSIPRLLWTSSDDGKTWQQIHTPDAADFFVQSTKDTTLLCALQLTGTDPNTQLTGLTCSADAGADWAARTVPMLPVSTTGGAGNAAIPLVLGYLDDGALLGETTQGTAGRYTTSLYRLTPGATAWESLGTAPTTSKAPEYTGYVDSPTPGIFWAVGEDKNGQPAIYSAVYPQASATPTTTKGATPNATSGPATMQGWQTAVLPPGLNAQGVYSSIGVAPGDSMIAYACSIAVNTSGHATTTGAHPHIWLTRTHANFSWSELPDLPIASSTQQPLNVCTVAVDESDPTTAIATVGWIPPGSPPYEQESLSVVTHNSGGSWTQLPGHYQVTEFTTQPDLDNTTSVYMLGSNQAGTVNGPPDIYLSTDGMRTWRPIDQGITGVGVIATNIWPGDQSGMLFAQVKSQQGMSVLYETQDDGKSWSQVGPKNLAMVDVRPPVFSNPLRICLGTTNIVNGALQSGGIQCSADDGQTWRSYPTPTLPPSCDGCVTAAKSVTGQANALWVGPEGELYATVPDGQNSQALLMLDPRANTWQTIATDTPIASVVYAPEGPGVDGFWLFPGGLPWGSGYVGPGGTVYVRL